MTPRSPLLTLSSLQPGAAVRARRGCYWTVRQAFIYRAGLGQDLACEPSHGRGRAPGPCVPLGGQARSSVAPTCLVVPTPLTVFPRA